MLAVHRYALDRPSTLIVPAEVLVELDYVSAFEHDARNIGREGGMQFDDRRYGPATGKQHEYHREIVRVDPRSKSNDSAEKGIIHNPMNASRCVLSVKV